MPPVTVVIASESCKFSYDEPLIFEDHQEALEYIRLRKEIDEFEFKSYRYDTYFVSIINRAKQRARTEALRRRLNDT